MDFTYTKEQESWRQRVREFMQAHVTEEIIKRSEEDYSEWDEGLYMELAKAGFTRIAIPKEFGGEGRSYTELAIFAEEAAKAELPHGVDSVYSGSCHFGAMAVVRLGTPEQQAEFLPKIMSGEIRLALGLTEPGCGSDLAAVETRAVADGDEFVLNGSKSFNNGRISSHMFCVVRTDPDVPQHKGISLFLVDLRSPNVSMTSFRVLRGFERATVHLDDVRVPRTALLGRENMGWYDLMGVMDLERSMAGRPAMLERLWRLLVAYTQETERDGKPLVTFPEVRRLLADTYREIAIGRLLCYRVIAMQEAGEDATDGASLQKLYNSEVVEHLALAAMDIIGPLSTLEWVNAGDHNKRLAPLGGLIARLYKDSRINQIAGGSSEIQRNMIATRALGLPKG